jgi:hypothetical protein
MFTSDKDLLKPVAKRGAAVRPQRTAGLGVKTGVRLESSESEVSRPSPQPQLGAAAKANTTDLLEIAKVEREQRAIAREQAVIAVRIQKWFRGRHAAGKHHDEIAARIKAKVDDVEKISTLLAQKGAEFVTPPALAMPIIVDFLFLGRYTKQKCNPLVTRLCNLVVGPSVTSPDASKNFLVYQTQQDRSMRAVFRLCCQLLSMLATRNLARTKLSGKPLKRTAQADISYDKTAIAHTLQLLLGASTSYKMKYTPEIESAFAALRERLARENYLLESVRSLLMNRAEPLLSIASSETTSTGSYSTKTGAVSVSKSVSAAVTAEADRLFSIVLHFVEATSPDQRQLETQLTVCATRILTVPMLTLFLSPSVVAQFCRWKHFPQLLNLLGQASHLQALSQVTTPSAPTKAGAETHIHPALRVIAPGQWLLGNLAALSVHIAATSAASSPGKAPPNSHSTPFLGVSTTADVSAPTSSATLQSYLTVYTLWLSAYNIPEILQGRQGIIWQKQGTNSTAVAVPSGLEEQLLSWLQPEVLQGLTMRVLRPIQTPADRVAVAADASAQDAQAVWATQYGLAKDIADVTDALASSAYLITHKTLTDRQQESTWFTAKWAKKVANNVVGGFSLPSFSMFGSGSSLATGHKASTGAEKGGAKVGGLIPHLAIGARAAVVDTSGGSGSADVSMEVADPGLIHALTGLWAILLPSAACSLPESPPWRALTQLAFAGSIVPKLWCFLLESADLDKLATNFALPPGTSTASQKSASVGAVRDGCHVLYCIASVLRTVLVVLDDTELYEMGVRPLLFCLLAHPTLNVLVLFLWYTETATAPPDPAPGALSQGDLVQGTS